MSGNETVAFSRREVCTLGLAGLFGLVSIACGGRGASAAPSEGDAAAAGGTAAKAVEARAGGAGADGLPQPVEVAFPVTLTDDQGREVVVESLESVVACMGSFAKTWELAGGALAGVTSDALEDYRLEGAEGAAVVGDFTEPNLEQIMALAPTLVIMSASSAGKGGKASQVDLVEPLEAADIPVLTFGVTVFDDYLRMLRACCDLTGREDLYVRNGVRVRERVDAVLAAARSDRAKLGEAPSCLIMTTYSGGTRVSTSSSQAGAVLSELGATNLADENPGLLKDFSLESVVALDPDYIFALPMGNDAQAAERALCDQTEANPAWAGLTAVAEGRYVVLDPALFLYKPLDRWDEAYAFMAEALYGCTAEGLDA